MAAFANSSMIPCVRPLYRDFGLLRCKRKKNSTEMEYACRSLAYAYNLDQPSKLSGPGLSLRFVETSASSWETLTLRVSGGTDVPMVPAERVGRGPSCSAW